MLEHFGKTALTLAAVCSMGAAQAAVLTFDDLPAGETFFLSDYQGFRFGTNLMATTAWFHTDQVSAFYTPATPTKYISTDFQLYTGALFEATQGITSAVDFVFDGAFFSGFDRVRYQLFNNGVLVHTSADSALLNNTPTFHASGFSGFVDEVVVLGSQGFYALDNFTFNSGLNVPEPATYSLVVAALLAAGVSRRRRAR